MSEVVVVGAGITGCYLAYFLAKKGISVSLLDHSGMGEHATAKNPGGLNPLHGPGIPGIMSALAIRSFELHQELQPEIQEISGLDFEGHLVSRLELALNEDEIESLRESAILYNSIDGYSAEWLKPKELLKEEPRIARGVLAALLMKGNGMVNSYNYARAVSFAGKKLGVQLQKAEVVGIETSKGRVEHILTKEGKLTCDAVVFATGPWFEGPSRWLDTDLPVKPLKGQLLLAEMPGRAFPYHITRGAVGIYVTPTGRIWLGGTQEDVGFDASPTVEGRKEILAALSEIIPDIVSANIFEHLAAFRPVTPDRFPLVGRVPDFENAFVASGGGVKGLLLSTGIAEAVVAEITSRALPDSVKAFSPSRFINNSSSASKN